MFFKTSLSIVTLGAVFLLTGWIFNWAPLHVMLTNEGYYADYCDTQLSWHYSVLFTTCNDQEVEISLLWSAVLLSECTVLPTGILLDYIGPSLFSLFILLIHAISLIAIIYMPRGTPMLYIPFFCIGMAVQACSILAFRTVHIFETYRARQVWAVAVGTLFDSSAIVCTIFYLLWKIRFISLDGIFWMLAIIGGVLYGAIALLWLGLKHAKTKSNSLIAINEESPVVVPIFDIFTNAKFYFFVFLCGVNIYRIRYFLGLVGPTLIYLNDDGTYLELFGWSFVLSVVFAPVVSWILSKLNSQYSHLRCINFSILAYFVTWMIPNLQLQPLTFALFILSRLFTFSVLTEYCATEFPAERFGLVMGTGFLAAAIPGAFTYKIEEITLDKYNGNFWVFHLICITMSIPVALITCYFQRKVNDLYVLSSDTRFTVSL